MLTVPYTPFRSSIQGLSNTVLFVEVARALGRIPEWGEELPISVWLNALHKMGTSAREWRIVLEHATQQDESKQVQLALAARAKAIFEGTDPLAPEWEAMLPRHLWTEESAAYYPQLGKECPSDDLERSWWYLLQVRFFSLTP
jgi:hypothetical protein